MNHSPLTRLALATSLALAAALPAQQNVTVFPSDHADPNVTGGNLPGSSWQNTFPFSAGVTRQMALYESFDLQIPDGRRITHVGFPRYTSIASTGVRIQLEIRMGHSTNDVQNIDATFANNYVGTPQTVFTQKIFALPDLGTIGNATDRVWVPLDTPFTVDRSRNLLVEYVVTANANSNSAFNYYLAWDNFLSPIRSYGQGCAGSSGNVSSLTSSNTAIGQNWRLTLRNGTANAASSLFVGLQSIEPGISLTQFGAPGCSLLVQPLITVPAPTSSSGGLSLSFPVPNDRNLVGGHLYSQVVTPDLFANNAGLVLSNGDDLQLGIQPLVATVVARNSATAATGSVTRNFGGLSLFGWQ